jgi:hypothetical protein
MAATLRSECPMARSRRSAEAREPAFQQQDHPPLLLSRALMLLAGEWTSSGVVRQIDPNLVLAEAWRPDRLRRCRDRLAAGEQAPAISVVGFRLGRYRVLYGVSDGMHRTVAHRETGRKVKAKIGGYYPIEPTRHALWRNHLWRREDGGLRLLGMETVLEDLRLILLALGVEPRDSAEEEAA